MTISKKEKEILIEKSKFLMDKNYEIEIDDNSIMLSNGICQIIAGFPPMSTLSEVGIRFIKENDYFPVDWIAAVRDNLIVNCNDKLNAVIKLLEYTEENYENITTYKYCVESEKLISGYLKNIKKS